MEKMAIKQHTLFWGSSYDRGLDILLKMWPAILSQFPDAKLNVCYGWELFDRGYANNPERMEWKKRMDEGMKQQGISHWGRVSKERLGEIRQECGIWAYPTYFPEINCITALDCQRDGVVPVTMDSFALKETVGSGVKVEGDIYDKEIQAKYLAALLNMMENTAIWEKEVEKAKEFAKDYSWDVTALKWENYFE